MTRNELLLQNIRKNMDGIEIGPFYSPVVPKADGWKTTVIDFTDQDGLLHIANHHDAQAIRDNAHRIEKVDIVWKGEPLDDIGLALNPQGYDFLIASHVIEHIPNLIGFFGQLSKLLKPGGIISLAVPDMRYCFDFFKTATTTSRVLAADRLNYKFHSPETMFEAHGYSGMIDGMGSWERRDRTRHVHLAGNAQHAYNFYLDYARKIDEGTQSYADAHAWYFTPANFELVILELNSLGLIDFAVSALDETPGAEFITQLKRQKLNLSPAELQKKREELSYRIIIETGERAAAAAQAVAPANEAVVNVPAIPYASYDLPPIKVLIKQLIMAFIRRLTR